MRDWITRRRFLWLLTALLGLLVLVPADRADAAGRVVTVGLITAVYLAGFGVVLAEPRHRLAGLLFGLPALAGAWSGAANPAAPHDAVVVARHAAAVLFLVFVTYVVLRSVFRPRAVTVDDVAGALCGYLLIGAAFGHAFCLAEELAPGSFHGDDVFAAGPRDAGRVYLLLTYFSFVTLTTVGYGDITPASGLTRGLTTVEAVVGQFYLAVLIGDLIGKRVAQTLAERPSGRPDHPPSDC